MSLKLLNCKRGNKMAENLTHWKKLTNPNYLGSWDITSGSLIVTIKQIEQKMIFNQQKQQEELCTTAFLPTEILNLWCLIKPI